MSNWSIQPEFLKKSKKMSTLLQKRPVSFLSVTMVISISFQVRVKLNIAISLFQITYLQTMRDPQTIG